jgi:hypothetical protein
MDKYRCETTQFDSGTPELEVPTMKLSGNAAMTRQNIGFCGL